MGAFSALALLAALSLHPSSAKCLPIEDAIHRVGDRVCVAGKVFKVEQEASGMHILHFCDVATATACPFQVVVYPHDLRDVGDVRWLEGKDVEIRGAIKDRSGIAEMTLNDARQLRGAAAKLPLIPKQYDVESRGKFSAGKSQARKHNSPHRSRRKGDVEPQPAPDDSGIPPPP